MNINKNIVDWLKVLCAVAVMVMHYCAYATVHENLHTPLSYLLAGGITYIGPVAIFFFLSGYGLMESERKKHQTSKQYLLKRLCKVYLPVLMVTAIWLPIYLTNINGGNSFPAIIRMLFWDGADGAMWFIKSLLLLYIVFLGYTLIDKRHPVFAILFLIVGTAAVQYYTNSFAEFSAYLVMMFSIGVLGSRYRNFGNSAINIATIMLAVYGLIGGLFYHSAILVANCLVLACIVLIFSNPKTQALNRFKCPALLLALSFDIYLTHYKILMYITSNNLEVSAVPFFLAAAVAATLFYLLRKIIITNHIEPRLMSSAYRSLVP